jgi:hypothetical protein
MRRCVRKIEETSRKGNGEIQTKRKRARQTDRQTETSGRKKSEVRNE